MTIDLGIDGLSEVEELGRGGSARVFKAWQVDLARPVAVKVLNSSWDEAVGRRFDRERKAMGRLSSHTGIVDIYATGATADGSSYLIMPYYRRGSLEDLINIEGPQPWRTATSLMASAAATMADAHRLGIIHRDLKPANILIGDDSFPKITDFGISALVDHHTVTMTSGLTFTPSYSPPEAFTSSAANTQRDVYGLGATLWSLLAGRAPFSSAGERVDLQHLIGRVMTEPVADLRPAVPDAVCRVIEKAMAKLPEDRQPDAAAFVTELGHAIGSAESADGVHTQTIEAAAPLTPPRITPPSAPPAAAAAQLGVPDFDRREPFFAEQQQATPEPAPAHQLPAHQLPAQNSTGDPGAEPFRRTVPLAPATGRTQRRGQDLGMVLKIAAAAAVFLALFGAGAFALTKMGDDPSSPSSTGGSIPATTATPTSTAPSSTVSASTTAPTTTTTDPSTTEEPPPTTAKQVTPTNPVTPRITDPPTPPTNSVPVTPPITDPPEPPKCPTWNLDCIAG